MHTFYAQLLCIESVQKYCAVMGTTSSRGRHRARSGSTSGRSGCWPIRCGCGCSARCASKGPATATTLAGLLGTNTGATSYHLRQLAEVGLVVEEPDRGSGRQRWWRAAHDVTNWEPTDFDDDPDARAAVEWIQGDQVRLLVEQAERWFAAQHEWSRRPGGTPSA